MRLPQKSHWSDSPCAEPDSSEAMADRTGADSNDSALWNVAWQSGSGHVLAMFTLRPTLMLAKRIGVSLPADVVPVETLHADWCAHGFTAQRYRYLILTNTHSLFSVVTHATGVNSQDAFIRHALAAISERLRESGRAAMIERYIGPASAEVRLARLTDRAVMGSINELIFLAKCDLIEGGLSPAEVSGRLNEVPCSMLWKRKGPGHPNGVFDAMLPTLNT